MILQNINFGGWADSRMQGAENSVAELVGLDVHSDPGAIFAVPELSLKSLEVTGEIRAFVQIKSGSAYEVFIFGDTTGKVYNRDNSGGYSDVGITLAPSAGGITVLDAIEYNGYIYYAMESRLGAWQIGSSWASRNDDFLTFTNTNAEHHPLYVQNDTLYCGDGNLVACVDNSGTGYADALDLPETYEVTTLSGIVNSLVIGTRRSGGARIFEWDTVSTSWNSEYGVNDDIVNSFLNIGGKNVAQVGNHGDLLVYNGEQWVSWKRVPKTATIWNMTDRIYIPHRGASYLNGVLFFLVRNSQGTTVTPGIWELRGHSSLYPEIFSCLYPIGTPTAIGANINPGDPSKNTLLIGHKDDDTGKYKIYELNTNRYTDLGSYFTTMLINASRQKLKTIAIEIFYRSLPNGTNITIHKIVNNNIAEEVSMRIDTTRNMLLGDVVIPDCATLQLTIGLDTNGGASTPIIEGINIFERQ